NQLPNAFARGMEMGIASWMSHPERAVLKAVDSEGTIAGFVCWATRGLEQGEAEKAINIVNNQGVYPPADQQVVQEVDKPQKIKELEAMTSKDLRDWMEILMPPGTKCRFIASISVLPKYQSSGVGSMLLGWGTKRCDEDGVYCWVHSSEAGKNMFAKAGFEEVGSLRFDLNDYDEEGSGPDPYSFTYMKRMPKP
ncbi:hypothetical protein HDV03_002142, partial [Kappamyces sp. JEL0829]